MEKLFVLYFLSFWLSQAEAQFKNVLLDPGSVDNQTNEPSIAISLKDPNIIVAASSLNNAYYTSNGGFSWQKTKLTSPLGVWGNPALISDFKGNFFYFHRSDPTGKNWNSEEILDRIVVQESNDNGVIWSEGASIGLNHPKDQDKARAIADRKGNFYVTWTQFDTYGSADTTCQSNILLSNSANGKKWSKPIQISKVSGDCKNDDNTAAGAIPAVSSDGLQVFVAWANQGKIFLDRSFDGGKTWLNNDIEIIEQVGGSSIKVPGLNKCNSIPILICNNTKKSNMSGALYLVWADQLNGEQDTDIWFTRSMNFGDNWAQAIRINNDGLGKHQYLPWMTIDPTTGHIYIVYYDRRNHDDLQTEVYLAYSTDGGLNFKNVKISEKPFVPSEEVYFGDYINISASHGVVAPIWTRIDNKQTSVWTTIIKHEELERIK